MPMYGPGNMKGKAAFNRYTKASKAATAVKATIVRALAPRRAPKHQKALTKAVQSVLARSEETKYVAENISAAPIVVPATQTTPLNLARMFPVLGQGVAENQRIGDQVKPTHARTFWTFYLNRSVPDLFDVTLNVVVVYVKGATTDVAVAALPAGNFLKVGDGTNTDPSAPSPVDMLTKIQHYPVNSDQFTLKKWFRKRICKGASDINGPVGLGTNNSPPTAGAHPCLTLQYKWKPPTLKYSDAAQTLPRNHYPVYLVWATANDGSALTGLLSFNVRSELFFKDA